MTKEEKSLLLKDLCARLPHKQKVYYKTHDNSEEITETLSGCLLDYFKTGKIAVVKPYLRPMSSMTKEEASDMFNTMFSNFRILSLEIENDRITFAKVDAENNFGHMALFFNKIYSLEQIEWLNAHHFDYRGLIENGLALEAPEGMYKHE